MSQQPYRPDPNSQSTEPMRPRQEESEVVRSAQPAGSYAQSEHTSYREPSGDQIDERSEVFEDPNQRRIALRYWISTVTSFVLGVVEAILLLRFVFRLLGANTSSSFVALLYDVSAPLVAPFKGIFVDPILSRAGVLEVSALIAMLIYALIAAGIIALGRVLYAPVPADQQSMSATRRRRFS